jgi:hypothetical protein
MRSRELRGIVLFVVAAVLAGASAYLYVGPYRWIAELQQAVFGAYYVQLTFVVTLIACAAPLVLARLVLERQQIGGSPEPELSARPPWMEHTIAALTASPRAAQAMLFGVGLAGLGLFLAARDLGSGPLTTLDVAVLERGEETRSRHVDLVGGVLLADRSAAFRDGPALRTYVPYASHDGASVAFVEIDQHERDAILEGPLRGLLERDGLPGPVRVDFEERAEIAPTHWVLRYGSDPERGWFALWAAGAGLVLLAIGSAVVVVTRPRP